MLALHSKGTPLPFSACLFKVYCRPIIISFHFLCHSQSNDRFNRMVSKFQSASRRELNFSKTGILNLRLRCNVFFCGRVSGKGISSKVEVVFNDIKNKIWPGTHFQKKMKKKNFLVLPDPSSSHSGLRRYVFV